MTVKFYDELMDLVNYFDCGVLKDDLVTFEMLQRFVEQINVSLERQTRFLITCPPRAGVDDSLIYCVVFDADYDYVLILADIIEGLVRLF